MILFLEDWDKYPSAYPDTQTKNKHFIRYAGLLKAMNIENHSFCLALHNPALQGVDPHSPDLTEQQVGMIVEEAHINYWYYIRECVKAPPVASSTSLPFRADRSNITMYWLFFNHITCMIVQIRQTGKSFGISTLASGLLNIHTKNSKMGFLTKDDALRTETVDLIKNIIKELPNYLNFTESIGSRNKESISINKRNNHLRSFVGQASPGNALKLGRGHTLPITLIDEPPFVANIGITVPAMLSACIAARDSAKKSGYPYGIIFTTTAASKDNRDGKYAYNLFQSGFKWTEKMFDCKNLEEVRSIISKNTEDGSIFVSAEFNHRQLGYTDEWLMDVIKETKAKGIEILTDFLNRWVSGTSTSPIKPKILKTLIDSQVNEHNAEISQYEYVTRWYVSDTVLESEEFENTAMVLALDTSDAIGNDDIALVLRSVKTGAVLAVGQFNETNIATFSEWVATWFVRFPKLVAIIERRSTGSAIMDNIVLILKELNIDPFTRLFNWVVDEKEIHPKRFEDLQIASRFYDHRLLNKFTKFLGFATSGAGKTARSKLYGDALINSVKYTGDGVKDPTLIKQIVGLETKSGRIDHSAGEKDDLVIAWMLGYWFLTQAKNIDFYGIRKSQVLQSVISGELHSSDIKKQTYIKEQQILRRKITDLLDNISEGKNFFKNKMMLMKVRLLYREIDIRVVKPINIEEVLKEINLKKEKGRV